MINKYSLQKMSNLKTFFAVISVSNLSWSKPIEARFMGWVFLELLHITFFQVLECKKVLLSISNLFGFQDYEL